MKGTDSRSDRRRTPPRSWAKGTRGCVTLQARVILVDNDTGSIRECDRRLKEGVEVHRRPRAPRAGGDVTGSQSVSSRACSLPFSPRFPTRSSACDASGRTRWEAGGKRQRYSMASRSGCQSCFHRRGAGGDLASNVGILMNHVLPNLKARLDGHAPRAPCRFS